MDPVPQNATTLPICDVPMPTVLLQAIVGDYSKTTGLCTNVNEDGGLLVISDYESIMGFIPTFVLADCWAVTHSIDGRNTVADVLYYSYNNNLIRCEFANNPRRLLSLDKNPFYGA